MICPCCGKHKRPENIAGLGTALKPAMELIALARKPLSEKNVAENVLRHGTGALNIDACRVEGKVPSFDRPAIDKRNIFGDGLGTSARTGDMNLGRWPANLLLDDSEEVRQGFPESAGQQGDVRGNEPSGVTAEIFGKFNGRVPAAARADSGSAARFFATFPHDEPQQRFWYGSKADGDDRLGSKHPTVKPLGLMQWLVKLICPPNGLVLDPFAGTGTTGEAAWREGMRAILIEREPEYLADIARRMELATQPTKRAAVAKTKNNLNKPEDLPLFAGGES